MELKLSGYLNKQPIKTSKVKPKIASRPELWEAIT